MAKRKKIISLRPALAGIRDIVRSEQHARIHLLIAIIVLTLSRLLGFSFFESLFLVTAIGFVFLAEIVNTLIEYMADFIEPNHKEVIRKIKDMAAGMVLTMSFFAICIAILIVLGHYHR